jgi:hypothetical protein
MFNPWCSAMLLAFEAGDVARLRIMKIAHGSGARDEARLMVTEKVGAGIEAFGSMMAGRTPLFVIERYRERVAANAHRLNGRGSVAA